MRVLQVMADKHGVSSSEGILASLALTDDERLHWLPVIWSMLLQRRLYTDLDTRFGGDVELRLAGAAR